MLFKRSIRCKGLVASVSISWYNIPKALYAALCGVAQSIADVLAPHECLVCGKVQELMPEDIILRQFICQACFDALPESPPHNELLAAAHVHFPHDNLALSRIISRFQLSPPMKDEQDVHIPSIEPLIYALKYGNKPKIGYALGQELGEMLRFRGELDYDAIVPVPLHSARLRERGYNQAEVLGKGIAHVLQIPLESTYLRRARYTRSQTLLTAKERVQNLQNVIVGAKASALQGAQILLVDDVFTTGATLNSCALALLESGVQRVDAVTVAKA